MYNWEAIELWFQDKVKKNIGEDYFERLKRDRKYVKFFDFVEKKIDENIEKWAYEFETLDVGDES